MTPIPRCMVLLRQVQQRKCSFWDNDVTILEVLPHCMQSWHIRDAKSLSQCVIYLQQHICGVCRRKWRLTDTDLCPCGETQTMSHIVESCPLTTLNGGLSRLHSADEDAVSWLTNYGKWHAYEKKKNSTSPKGWMNTHRVGMGRIYLLNQRRMAANL